MIGFIKKLFGLDKKENTSPVIEVKDTRKEDISNLYKDILGRDPDPDGLAWWVSAPASIEEIKAEFLKSDEYKLKVRTDDIIKIYDEILGRAPDAEGLKWWVESPATIDEIKVEMMKSDEYLAKITPKEEKKVVEKATARPQSKGRPKKVR